MSTHTARRLGIAVVTAAAFAFGASVSLSQPTRLETVVQNTWFRFPRLDSDLNSYRRFILASLAMM